jgi:hypothetical protein
MLSKTLIASAAVASALMVAVPAEQAQAKTHVDIGIGLGVGGFYPGYPVYDDYYDAGYYGRPHLRGLTCGQAANEVRAEGFRRVRAVDCSRPVYGFRAERHGRPVIVKVNTRGEIIAVRRAGYDF